MQSPIVAAFSLIAASSLQAPTARQPAPPAAPSPPPAPVDYSVAVPLAGDWTYAPATDGTEATFRDAARRPQLMVKCVRAARQVTIAKPATGAAPFMLVWTSSLSRQVPASFNPLTNRISIALPAADPLLDGIAFSRGRFAVGVVGSAALIVPAWPDVARVVEDCRG